MNGTPSWVWFAFWVIAFAAAGCGEVVSAADAGGVGAASAGGGGGAAGGGGVTVDAKAGAGGVGDGGDASAAGGSTGQGGGGAGTGGAAPGRCSAAAGGKAVTIESTCAPGCALCYWNDFSSPRPAGCKTDQGVYCAADCGACP